MDKQLFHLQGIKKNIVFIGVLTIIQGVAIIFQALFLARAITKLFKGAAISVAVPFFSLFLLFFIVRHVLQWGIDRKSYRFAEKHAINLQELFIRQVFQLGPSVVNKLGSGSVVTLCLEGISKFRTYLELFIPRSIGMIIIPVTILIYVFTLDVLSGIVLVVTMPILIAFLILLGLVAQKKIDRQMGTYQLLASHFVDSLRGIATLKLLGKSKSHIKAIESVSDKHRKATIKTLQVAFLSSFSLDFFASLSVAVVAVELGLRLIDGNIGLESSLAILILAPEYFLPIRTLGADYHATMDGKETGKQIYRLLEKRDEKQIVKNISIPSWNEKSKLEIHGLERRGENGEYILKEIDLSVQGYKKIGIVGESGAGKSTLIDILAGWQSPSSGTFSINGVNITDFSHQEWQKQITYIPQHPYIFSGTVADNICFYTEEATMEQIEEAATVTGLSKVIEDLPRRFEEKIGQGGRSLSGGEEQRIALARFVLQERPIMLFDEPTAHLDIETEYELKKTILPLLERKLVFFATHRLHWMKEMDQIIVLRKGKIVELGSHDELFNKKGVYYHLIQAQKGNGR